jgi:hypothetical protein
MANRPAKPGGAIMTPDYDVIGGLIIIVAAFFRYYRK